MPDSTHDVRPLRQHALVPAAFAAFVAVAATAGCQPTVKIEAPDKPITINLNIRIEQEIRIKIEKDAERLLEEKKDLF